MWSLVGSQRKQADISFSLVAKELLRLGRRLGSHSWFGGKDEDGDRTGNRD